MQNDPIFVWIYGFFDSLFAQPLRELGIPLGPGDYFLIFYTLLFVVIIGVLVRRSRRGNGVPEGVKTIIASTGDVSAGMTGTKKVDFLRTPSEAIVFLKIEENAIEQALLAVDYYVQQGEIDEVMKAKLTELYRKRLEAVQAAIVKESDLKDIVETDAAVDKARSDYLRKMAAMSGTTVEDDSADVGPPSVGAPRSVTESTPATTTPATDSGPPGGAAPSGGPPGGAAPSGGPPGGAAPSSGPPGGAAPSGGPPGGAAPSGGPPGGAAPSSGPPGGAAPSSTAAADTGTPKSSGGKSTLQAEMLAEMERLRTLMSGD